MQFALIGYPLTHSMSPFIHRQLFSLSGVNASYQNIEISPEALTAHHPVFSEYQGVNVTIPHKITVIPFLKALCGEATLLKTVNTIVRRDDGLYGFNTDCTGFLEALRQADISLSGHVLLCGCGGTSRMMCYLAARARCEITIVCRAQSLPRAQALAQEVRAACSEADITVTDNARLSGTFDLLLNGTPTGMYPNNLPLLPVSEQTVSRCAAVFDAVYNPRQTRLLLLAAANGAQCAYGMPMLVCQAAAAQHIWYGAEFDTAALEELVERANDEMERMFSQ